MGCGAVLGATEFQPAESEYSGFSEMPLLWDLWPFLGRDREGLSSYPPHPCFPGVCGEEGNWGRETVGRRCAQAPEGVHHR